jgi:hypothetical protein
LPNLRNCGGQAAGWLARPGGYNPRQGPRAGKPPGLPLPSAISCINNTPYLYVINILIMHLPDRQAVDLPAPAAAFQLAIPGTDHVDERAAHTGGQTHSMVISRAAVLEGQAEVRGMKRERYEDHRITTTPYSVVAIPSTLPASRAVAGCHHSLLFVMLISPFAACSSTLVCLSEDTAQRCTRG